MTPPRPSAPPAAPRSAQAGISVRALVKRYPRSRELTAFLRHPFAKSFVTALDGIDLELEPGRVYGLVGHNGAGKTTLLKVLGGLVLPSAGAAVVCGIDAVAHPRDLRNVVGLVVADERSFFWRITVRENLRFFATLQQLGRAGRERAVETALERLSLREIGDVAFKELSTGQRQRLAIARGLLIDPPVLLMDEATRSLDPGAAREVRELVRAVARDRPDRIVVYSSHSLSEVEDLCDEVVALRAGRVAGRIEHGARDDGGGLYRLRTRIAAPHDAFEGLPGVRVVDGAQAGAVEVELAVDSPECLDGVARRALERGLGLVELRPERSSLERWLGDEAGR